MKNKRNKIWTILIIVLMLIFSLMLFLVITNKVEPFDSFLNNIVYRDNIITNFMKFFTFFGETLTLSSLAIILFILVKNKRISILIPINLFIIGTTNHLIKLVVARERPFEKLIEETGFSFPSGHSASSLAFYGFLIYLIQIKLTNKTLKTSLTLLLSLLILLIGFSRVYLQVHYPSDVIGAFSYAGSYLILFIMFTQRIVNSIEK